MGYEIRMSSSRKAFGKQWIRGTEPGNLLSDRTWPRTVCIRDSSRGADKELTRELTESQLEKPAHEKDTGPAHRNLLLKRERIERES